MIGIGAIGSTQPLVYRSVGMAWTAGRNSPQYNREFVAGAGRVRGKRSGTRRRTGISRICIDGISARTGTSHKIVYPESAPRRLPDAFPRRHTACLVTPAPGEGTLHPPTPPQPRGSVCYSP